jgi:hypothetical protein
MHVLLVGELAYNADRIEVLVERTRRLSGLWIDDPLPFMTVGPVPGVRDLPPDAWVAALRRDPPDVAYCLLNWRTIPLALAVADAAPGLPLVWHFKEAPQRSLARGDWPLLTRLWYRADAVVLASAEQRAWMLDALPGRDPGSVHAIDGDLPPARWFTGRTRTPTPLHTVCPGRPIGLDADAVRVLGRDGVHVHLHGTDPGLAEELRRAAPETVHVHPPVAAARWRFVLSGYDAGWLHVSSTRNGGDLHRATWDHLNLPARIPTLAAAGLPCLLPDATGEVSAVDRVVGAAGLRFRGLEDVGRLLRDRPRVAAARAEMERRRFEFTFDAVVDDLLAVLTRVAGEAAA